MFRRIRNALKRVFGRKPKKGDAPTRLLRHLILVEQGAYADSFDEEQEEIENEEDEEEGEATEVDDENLNEQVNSVEEIRSDIRKVDAMLEAVQNAEESIAKQNLFRSISEQSFNDDLPNNEAGLLLNLPLRTYVPPLALPSDLRYQDNLLARVEYELTVLNKNIKQRKEYLALRQLQQDDVPLLTLERAQRRVDLKAKRAEALAKKLQFVQEEIIDKVLESCADLQPDKTRQSQSKAENSFEVIAPGLRASALNPDSILTALQEMLESKFRANCVYPLEKSNTQSLLLGSEMSRSDRRRSMDAEYHATTMMQAKSQRANYSNKTSLRDRIRF